MKHTITFTLPEEQEELKDAQNGTSYKIVLSDLDNWLRSKLKYEELPKGAYEHYEAMRKQLHALLQEDNLEI